MTEDQMYDAAEREMDLYRAEHDRVTAKLAEVREVLADVLRWIADPGIERPGPEAIAAWRERAGLEDS